MTLRKNISTIAHIAIMATIFLVSSTGFTLVNSMLKIGAIISPDPIGSTMLGLFALSLFLSLTRSADFTIPYALISGLAPYGIIFGIFVFAKCPLAIAAYSYMALVPVIIPLVVKIWCTKKELSINMKEQEKKYPSSVEIKNLRVLKIVFPIVVTTVVALFVPSAVPLIGMLMFGNLIKEIGSDTSRLFDAASNSIMNAATIFLGLSVGATMTTEAFLNWTTIGIVVGGFLAFALSISGGILFVKLVNLFTNKKINPLIGATGLSAVPMASRVANEIALKYDPKNHVLQYCMASNISGVIGSAVAAGVLISFLQ